MVFAPVFNLYHPKPADLVRPFVVSPFLQKVIDSRPPKDDESEAELRWGKAANFTQVDPPANTNPRVVAVNFPDDTKDDGKNDNFPLLQCDEVYRKTEDVRVENPDDSEQYVIVRRAVFSILQLPGNIYMQVTWKND